MDEIVQTLKALERRIETMERNNIITNVTIPTTGKLIVDSHSSDPTAENGRIYYNTTTNKYKVCESGTWKTITTS